MDTWKCGFASLINVHIFRPHSQADDGKPATFCVLPRILKVFLERIGEGSHNMAHFYEDCHFSYTAFNDKMRATLYNTKRQLKRRKNLSKAMPVTGVKRGRSADGQDDDDEDDNDQMPMPMPGVDGQTVADALSEYLGWDKGLCLEYVLRRVKIRLAYPKDPLYEDEDLQEEVRELQSNARAGRVEEAKQNLKKIKEAKGITL